jgi:hypothetical protein
MSRVSRRGLLRAGAASVALPFLPSLLPRGARAGGEGPLRIVFFFVPNGMHMPSWTPVDDGPGFTLSPILSPLAAHSDRLLVVSGLSNRSGEADVAGDHARGTGSFLSCVPVVKSEGDGIRNGISFDQALVPYLSGGTAFPSLQLGIDGGDSVGNCDSGYSCAYVRNISWADEVTPLAKTVSPRVLFDRLFAGFDPGETEADRVRRRTMRTSVLDHVIGEAESLQSRLGSADRVKLEGYLDGVRALETRIETAEVLACDVPETPGQDLTYLETVAAMTDLLAVSLACDATRVVSFMLGNGASYRSFGFLGVQGAHHEISHHQNDPAKQAQLEIIDTWESTVLASLLDRLAAEDEGECTLLDNTLVVYSSEVADGNGHWHYDLPMVLAGGFGGRIATGRHLRLAAERPLADLFLGIATAAEAPIDTFGADSTGPLDLT